MKRSRTAPQAPPPALVLLFALVSFALAGCSFIPLLTESTGAGGAAGNGGFFAAPIVNSAIYSNDFTVDEGPVKGGSARIYATAPDTYNPLLTRNIYTVAMLSLVYESLATIGPDSAVTGRLAERWVPSADGMIWHVFMREGLMWHDGRPLRARDVVDTIDRIKSYGGLSPYAGAVSNILSATATSDLEIRLTLKKENSFTPYTWVFPIVPSHVMIDALDGAGGGANLRAALIGSGPYRFYDYENYSGLILTSSDTWNAGGDERADNPEDIIPPPYIDKVEFKFYDPAVTALSQFRSGDVDLFFSRTMNYFRYKSSSELRIKQYAERDFIFIAFNCSTGVTAARSVRRALLRMIDRQALIDIALEGRGVAAEFPVHPDSPLFEAGIVNVPYDLQAARSILENAGYRMDNGVFFGDSGGGWRSLSLTILVNESDAARCELADAISKLYAAGGVVINVLRDSADSISEKISKGEYDMALLDYRIPLYPDMTELYSTPWQEEENGANPAHYENADADRLSHELFTLYNEPDRQTAFSELAAIIQDDAPYIGICFKAAALVYPDDLRGGIFPNIENPLNNFENWYIADY